MTRILMRAAIHPLESNVAPEEAILKDKMNGNIGNMLFAHASMRVLMADDVEIDTVRTNRYFTDQEIDEINEKYDCFVIPLANAFRSSFLHELKILTRAIKKLKIPCVVLGVGMQAGPSEVTKKSFAFDPDVKKFISAVLEKSPMTGLRGEATADYLQYLGFTPEKDFTVIGCPSMYAYGALPKQHLHDLTPQSPVSVNRKLSLPERVQRFIYEQQCKFDDAVFIPQNTEDLILIYAGRTMDLTNVKNFDKSYPYSADHPILMSGKELGFYNVPSWQRFLSEKDFSFGTRIHGNIAAVLSGTPAFIFAPDSRVRELAEYHKIPHMLTKDIKKDTDIFKIYEKTDFSQVYKGHKERFHHYVDFLETCNLPHIFGEERVNHRTRFDEILEAQTFGDAITAITLQDPLTQAKRLKAYYQYLDETYGTVTTLNRNKKVMQTLSGFIEKTPLGIVELVRRKTGL